MKIGLQTIILTAILLLVGWQSSGQFSISRVKPKDASTVALNDTIKSLKNISNEFFNKARWKAERRTIRKERNTTEFSATLQVAQTQFENWSAGGDNTFSGRSTLFFRHKHERKRFSIESRVEARYGLHYIEGSRFKNEDEFKINLLSGWKIHRHWSYALGINLRSQFSTGYKSRTDATRMSTFMAPGFLDMSFGFKYERKPFVLILSPVGGNAVFVMDKELQKMGMNGVAVGEKAKWKVGPSIRAEIDMEFVKQVFRLRSYLDSFTNLKKTPTFRWETVLDIRATKFLTTTLYALLYYDKEAITPRAGMQYKYSFSVGLSYTFKNK